MVMCIFGRKKSETFGAGFIPPICQEANNFPRSTAIAAMDSHQQNSNHPHPLPRSQGSWEREWESTAELLLLPQWKGAREKGVRRGVEWANQQHLSHLLNRAHQKQESGSFLRKESIEGQAGAEALERQPALGKLLQIWWELLSNFFGPNLWPPGPSQKVNYREIWFLIRQVDLAINIKHKQRRKREEAISTKVGANSYRAQLTSDLSHLFIVGCDEERWSPGKKYRIAYLCAVLERVADPALGDTGVNGQGSWMCLWFPHWLALHCTSILYHFPGGEHPSAHNKTAGLVRVFSPSSLNKVSIFLFRSSFNKIYCSCLYASGSLLGH